MTNSPIVISWKGLMDAFSLLLLKMTALKTTFHIMVNHVSGIKNSGDHSNCQIKE